MEYRRNPATAVTKYIPQYAAQPTPKYATVYHPPLDKYATSSSSATDANALAKLADAAVSRVSSMTAPQQRRPYLGGDPPNAYHEVRRFLMQCGIDTRVFSFGSIPLPEALVTNTPTNADNLGTLDNSFFFEFRKIIPASDGIRVNTLVVLARVFFEQNQDSARFHVQFVLNHHKDAIYELNDIYDDIISLFRADATWTEPSSASPSGRVTYFEKTYDDEQDFKVFMSALLAAFKEHGITGNNLIPTEPGF